MAHKKGQGSVKNGRDSNAQRRGIKVYAGTFVTTGSIIVRQNGTKFHPGRYVKRAKDDTLFALVDGTVYFDAQSRRVNIQPGSFSEIGTRASGPACAESSNATSATVRAIGPSTARLFQTFSDG